MDITRNKFSNAICVIFSVVLVGLFCVYTNSRLGLNNIVSDAIIAAVLCGIVACLIFFLNRIINKFSQGKSFNDKLIFNIAIIVVSLIFVVIRLLMISNVIGVPMQLGSIYDNAISNEGRIFVNLSTVEGITATIISLFIKILGNSSFSIILAQLILAIVSYVFLLFGIKNLMGKMATITVCAGLALGQIFYASVASDGIENILLFAFSLIVFLSARYKKSMDDYKVRWYFTLIIGLLLGLFGLYSKAFLFLPVIPLIVLWDCNSESNSTKAGHTAIMLISAVVAFIVPVILDAFLLGDGGIDGFIDTITKIFNCRFTISVGLTGIERVLSVPWILIVMLLCIAYCVLFWKNNDDAGHIMTTFSVLLLFQMFVLPSEPAGIFVMLVVVALLAIAGYGFVNIGYDPNQSDVYRIEDDMQPAVVQAIGNKVVASDEEIKKVFAENEEKAASLNVVPKENNEVVQEADASPKNETENILDAIKTEAEAPVDVTVEEPKEIVETVNATVETVNMTVETVNMTVETADEESKETRKTDDFGMSNSDFASMFDGSAVPPKFARGNMYDDWNDFTENESDEDTNTVTEEVIEEKLEEEPEEKPEEKTEEKLEEKLEEKPDDFGMNNTDFASLFSATSVPPKFARNDYYDDYEEIEEESKEAVEEATIEEPEEVETVIEENNDDSKDKKAYVDTFFSYLYDESVFSQPIEVPEEKVEPEEKYVSNAAKFSDLDLDLGIDAFDYVPENAEENVTASTEEVAETEGEESVAEAVEETNSFVLDEQKQTTEVLDNVVETQEFVEAQEVVETQEVVEAQEVVETQDEVAIAQEKMIEEDKTSDVSLNFFEGFKADAVEDVILQEASVETVADENSQNEEFKFEEDSFEDMTNKWNEDETSKLAESLDNYSQGVEEEIFKALAEFDDKNEENYSVEEAIEKKIMQEDFSYEDAINKRLAQEEFDQQNGFSLEEALVKKLEVEENLRSAEEKLQFSYEEVLSNKLVLEESLDSLDESGLSAEEVIAQKVELEETINKLDDTNEISIQEIIEQKIDVERDIKDAIDKPILDAIDEFESVEQSLSMGLDGHILNELDFVEKAETVEEEFLFEDKAQPVVEEFNFGDKAQPVVEEFSFEDKAQPVVEEFSFEDKAQPVEEEFSFDEKTEPVVDEFTFEELTQPIKEEFSFEDKVEPVIEEFSFEDKVEPIVEEFGFDEKTEPVVDEFTFEELTRPITDEFTFEEKTEPIIDEFTFEEKAEPIIDEFTFEEKTEPVEEEFAFEENVQSVEESIATTLDDDIAPEDTLEVTGEVLAETLTDEYSFDNGQTALDENDFEGDGALDESVFVEAANAEPKKIELIENPLPLPKKHVHREMDYGRSIPYNWMHYDVEVNSKNNFYDI